MFLRLLFVLLSALNIAVGAWLLLGQPYARGGSPAIRAWRNCACCRNCRSRPGGDVGRGREPAAGDATAQPRATAASRSARSPPRRTCATRARRWRRRPRACARARSRPARPAAGGSTCRPPAAARRRWQRRGSWRQRHIGDYFVVSSGDQPNTISLGLFKDPANARKRRDEIVAAGFPARMSERSESVPEYWLDLVVADAQPLRLAQPHPRQRHRLAQHRLLLNTRSDAAC